MMATIIIVQPGDQKLNYNNKFLIQARTGLELGQYC